MQSEYLCFECQQLSLHEQQVAELRRANDIEEWKLEQDGKPKPRYTPSPPPPPTETTQQYGKKGGISIGPGRSGSE